MAAVVDYGRKRALQREVILGIAVVKMILRRLVTAKVRVLDLAGSWRQT